MTEEMSDKMKNAFAETPDVSVNIPSYIEEEKHRFIIDLIAHAMNHLKIEEIPEILFVQERGDIPMTTGSYIPEENKLYVLVGGRALADYLRTLAHELTHVKQHLEGRIPEDLKGRNQELEAEANTQAGNIIFEFAHANEENQQIYEL